MTPEESVNLARKYVELSNEHDLEAIYSMFEEDATYSSSNVGLYQGKAAITEMMGGFFGRFYDVRWEVADYRLTDTGGVEFGFVRRATEERGGEPKEGSGVECIYFSSRGLISRVEVRTD